MMDIKKTIAGGMIAAAVATGGVMEYDRANVSSAELDTAFAQATVTAESRAELDAIRAEEIKFRKPGEELKTYRTETARVFKTANTERNMEARIEVYNQAMFFHDPDGDSLMALDLTVRDVDKGIIEEMAEIVGLDGDKNEYAEVKAGPYRARWNKEREYDYTITDMRGANGITYTALHDTTGMTVTTEPISRGMKQTWVLSEKATNTLTWRVTSEVPMIAGENGRVSVGEFVIDSPKAWDADGKAVQVDVGVYDNLLTYTVHTDGAAYPVTVDPTTLTQYAVNDYELKSDDASYTTARDRTTYETLIDGRSHTLVVGQYYDSGIYEIHRILWHFPISPTLNISTVSACSLAVYLMTDNSNTDFDVDLVWSHHKAPASLDWANDFYGWSSSGGYSLSQYAFAYKNTSTFSGEGFYKIPFYGSVWDDSLNAAIARNDTLRFAFLSSRDISNTTPTGTPPVSEKITIGGSGSATPYLSMTGTLKIPTGFTATGADPTRVVCVWNKDVIAGETGYRIKNIDTSAYMDTTVADSGYVVLTGLNVNTKYRLRVEVMGGTAAGQQSAIDSCYTLANTPGLLTVTAPNDSTIHVVVNLNGNPAHTEVAIQDSASGYYVHYYADLCSLLADAEWRTKANWGGTSGVNISKRTPAGSGVGKYFRLRAKARSGE